MEELQKGTPLWAYKHGTYEKGIYLFLETTANGLITYTDLCGNIESTDSPDCIKPLTVSEYIQHIMVPDGWQYRAVFKHLIKTVDDLTVVIFVNEKDCKPKIGTALGEITYFTDNNKNLGNQALTHCEKLKLLKELVI